MALRATEPKYMLGPLQKNKFFTFNGTKKGLKVSPDVLSFFFISTNLKTQYMSNFLQKFLLGNQQKRRNWAF